MYRELGQPPLILDSPDPFDPDNAALYPEALELYTNNSTLQKCAG